MNSTIRTDLALEAEALWRETQRADAAPAGVRARSEQKGCFTVTTVEVLDARGEAALGKPAGTYVTVELDALIRRTTPEMARKNTQEVLEYYGTHESGNASTVAANYICSIFSLQVLF